MHLHGMRRKSAAGCRMRRVTAIEVEEGMIPERSIRGIDWHGECYLVDQRRFKRMMRQFY